MLTLADRRRVCYNINVEKYDLQVYGVIILAKCYNCGVEIPDGDKTKLCDRCKKILLPFVKFMDASTSSAVRRLVSNEKNLRNAGVTDSGMEYLLRLCELHDKKRIMEREAKEAANAVVQSEIVQEEMTSDEKYSEVELPADDPLDFVPKQYGDYLPAAKIVLIVVGIVLAVWFVVSIIRDGKVDFVPAAASVGFFFASYVADVCAKLMHDLNEIRKRFK